jgi:hypothetical protein
MAVARDEPELDRVRAEGKDQRDSALWLVLCVYLIYVEVL